MLEVRDVSFKYKGHSEYALKGASFRCASGGVIAIVGRSGVGKSTLVSLLAGIYKVGDSVVGEYQGQISIDGQVPTEIRGPGSVSWVPQMPVLLEHLNVLQNVLLPISIKGKPAQQAVREAADFLEKLGLEASATCRPRELSGGMKTRVSLLRALISAPRYLYMDEPFVSLDLMNRWRIYKFLRTLRNSIDLTTILTTHNIPEAALLADRIILVDKIDGDTIISVELNEAKLLGDKDGEVCLKTAREVATSIEKRLFLSEVGQHHI